MIVDDSITFMRAIRDGETNTVESLIQQNTDTYFRELDVAGVNLIEIASYFGKPDIVQLLLENTNIDPSSNGNRAIIYAYDVMGTLLQDERVFTTIGDFSGNVINLLIDSNRCDILLRLMTRGILCDDIKAKANRNIDNYNSKLQQYTQIVSDLESILI